MGKLEVQILQLRRGHTKGDTVGEDPAVWRPRWIWCNATRRRRVFPESARDARRNRSIKAGKARSGAWRRLEDAARGTRYGCS